MTDPRRSDRPPSGNVPERDRDAHVEELLLSGLDHYFAGHYELAISVWTRVLFLNHGHARARAYIERARGAIAERQREGEELLQSGVDAFGRGDGAAARRLLTSAVERGASTEEALALLDRLNRLEGATGPQVESAGRDHPLPANTSDATVLTRVPGYRRAIWIASGIAAGILVAGVAGVMWLTGGDWRLLEPAPTAPVATEGDEPLPVPTASEAAMTRARALHATRQLHEALNALDGVKHGDPLFDAADALRATIQRELFAAASGNADSVPTAGQRGQVPRQ